MTVKHALRAPMSIGAGLLLFLVAMPAADKAGDEPRVTIEPRVKAVKTSDLSVDSSLVLIPVSVTDSKSHPVVGLDAHKFRVFEGKAEQQVLHVSADDAPVSVGIVFDASASMTSKLPKAREAVKEFLKTANPADEFCLVNFATKAELSVPFTSSAPDIQNRLMFADSKGKTALLDAVYLALDAMKGAANPRKALLIISDGGENDSRYTETEIKSIVRETVVWIYAIGIYSHNLMLPEEERGGPKLLDDLAEASGGRQFAVHNADDLPAAAAKIGMELRNQYLLGYRPAKVEHDGKYHKVQVTLVESGGLLLSWRPGYYAPGW